MYLHRLMLTCAIHPSKNLCCCSSPIWKPSNWMSAFPVWSSRQLLKSVERWVCFSCPLWLLRSSVFAALDLHLMYWALERSALDWPEIKDSIFFLISHAVSILSTSDIRRSEELSLLKPPDDPSKKKKKKDKDSAEDDIWNIDLLSMGPGSAGTVESSFLTKIKSMFHSTEAVLQHLNRLKLIHDENRCD